MGGVMNRRAYLKKAGALSVSLILALHASPGGAADPPSTKVLVTYHSVTGNTEKMAQGVAAGAGAVPATSVVLKRIGEVTGDDLLSAHAVIVGSPVYFGNMSGEVKTFFDSWNLKFGFQVRDRKMRNKVGGAFATGASASNGKELTMITILGAMLPDDRRQRWRRIWRQRVHGTGLARDRREGADRGSRPGQARRGNRGGSQTGIRPVIAMVH
jgi:flavodoxin